MIAIHSESYAIGGRIELAGAPPWEAARTWHWESFWHRQSGPTEWMPTSRQWGAGRF